MTPYTARNFAIGSPKAREGQLDRFFLQKWHFIYKLSVKKQRTGQKTGKNPPKKVVFPAPPISWLSLSEKGPGPFLDIRKRSGPFPDISEKGPDLFRISEKGPGPFSDKLSQLIGGAGKTTSFWRVFARFLSCFLLFHR